MDAAVAANKQGPKPKTIDLKVNGKPVVMDDKQVTGAEIKAAAIAHGVNIQPSFVLQLELPNGTGQIIGDADPVKIHNNMSFTAIRPDDNS